MSHQALLFCPDQKTRQIVGQLLRDLDFTPDPCTEPFASVKLLMEQHFDAVVVDCADEQNAALLFKGARNSNLNHSSLTVAIVEGQAGIAKAFRMGANLVLTKPINVDQAKGTLRVARGLMKKAEIKNQSVAAATQLSRPALVVRETKPAIPQAPVAVGAPPATFEKEPAAVLPMMGFEREHEPTPRVEAAEKAVLDSLPAPMLPSVEPEADMSGMMETKFAGAPVRPFRTSASAAAAAPAKTRDTNLTETPTHILEPISIEAQPEQQPAARAHEPMKPGMRDARAEAPMFGAGEEVPSGGGRKIAIAVAVILVLAGSSYLGWRRLNQGKEGAVSQAPPAAAMPTAKPSPGAAGNQAETTATSQQPSSEISVTPAGDSALAANASNTTAEANSSEPSVEVKSDESKASESNAIDSRPSDARNSQAQQNAAPKPQAKAGLAAPAPQKLVVKNDTTSKPARAETVAPPAITEVAAASGEHGIGSVMTTPVPVAKPVLNAVRVSQGVSEGLLIRKVQPRYPDQARLMHQEGSVTLEATVDKEGNISKVKVLNGSPLLARAAVSAVEQWKYKPYYLNGQPVEIQTQIVMNFRLP